MKVHCGILASGTGQRYSPTGPPKQLLPVAGTSLFMETLRIISGAEVADNIVIAVLPDLQGDFIDEIENNHFPSKNQNVFTIAGGDERIDSIKNIFDFCKVTLEADRDDVFLLVDANRPVVPADLYRRVVNAARDYTVSCPARPLVDGVAFVENGYLETIPDKKLLFSIQTPEACNFGELDRLFSLGWHRENSGLAEAFLSIGIRPKIVESDLRTYKVTYPGDLEIVEVLMKRFNQNDI